MMGARGIRWRNVWTIFRREARDQLRDRRTLFMVFVLPLLLYPILGIGILQLSATLRPEAADGDRRSAPRICRLRRRS